MQVLDLLLAAGAVVASYVFVLWGVAPPRRRYTPRHSAPVIYARGDQAVYTRMLIGWEPRHPMTVRQQLFLLSFYA